MSIQHVVTDLTFCAMGVIAVMYWFESRNRDIFRARAKFIMSALDKRAEAEEKERMVQTEKIAVLARSITLRMENGDIAMSRIEAAIERLTKHETKFIERIHNED